MNLPELLALVLLVAGCADRPDADGVPLEHGMWRISTKFGTPRLDGLSIDRLRDEPPADKSETKCFQPVLRSGARFVDLVNLNRDVCKLKTASIVGHHSPLFKIAPEPAIRLGAEAMTRAVIELLGKR